jgi:hypothetical protein
VPDLPSAQDKRVEFFADVTAERDRLRDLLARVLASSEDGTLEIPDVIHAMEAEIKEALDG